MYIVEIVEYFGGRYTSELNIYIWFSLKQKWFYINSVTTRTLSMVSK